MAQQNSNSKQQVLYEMPNLGTQDAHAATSDEPSPEANNNHGLGEDQVETTTPPSESESQAPKTRLTNVENQGASGDKVREDQLEEESVVSYPKGLRLVTMTLGIMACVLMVALDNYILGPSPII